MISLKDFFSGGVSKLVDSVGTVIDNIHTSGEEKLQLKIELEREINRFSETQLTAVAAFDKEITARHSNDMASDSWLSKNIRPLALAFLTVMTIALAWATIFSLPPGKVEMVKPWITLLTTLDVTAFTFYFGSRGFEKVKSLQK